MPIAIAADQVDVCFRTDLFFLCKLIVPMAVLGVQGLAIVLLKVSSFYNEFLKHFFHDFGCHFHQMLFFSAAAIEITMF